MLQRHKKARGKRSSGNTKAQDVRLDMVVEPITEEEVVTELFYSAKPARNDRIDSQAGTSYIDNNGRSASTTPDFPKESRCRFHPYVFRPALKPLKQDPWESIRVAMEEYDKQMCEAWNGELDTILVFTGLFSSAVTAFCVESFENLSQNPVNTTNAILLTISLQLANSSSPAEHAFITDTFVPDTHDVHINILYFISLTLALSVSLICILAKQWIREYEKDVVGTPSDAVRVRQMRYDSLEAWKVPKIIAALPVFVIIALLLFFAGFLVQLWHCGDHTTAISVSAIVILTTVVVIVTTVTPACYSSWNSRAFFVPFRSPQAWFCLAFFRHIQHTFHRVFFRDRKNRAPLFSNWTELDLHLLQIEARRWFKHDVSSIHRALRWVYQTLWASLEMQSCVMWCLESRDHIPATKLVKDMDHLTNYVVAQGFGDSGILNNKWNLARTWYDANIRRYDYENVRTPLGRYQVELLIRSISDAVDCRGQDWKAALDQVTECCTFLAFDHNIFRLPLSDDSPKYEQDIQVQMALMLCRLFISLDAVPPGVVIPQEFWHASLHLLQSTRYFTGSGVLEPHDGVFCALPAVIRKRKSISLVLDVIRYAYASHPLKGLVNAEQPLIKFDKVLCDLWKEDVCAEEHTLDNLERWRRYRAWCISKSREDAENPSSHLHDDFFDKSNGPLPSPDSCVVRLSPCQRISGQISNLTRRGMKNSLDTALGFVFDSCG